MRQMRTATRDLNCLRLIRRFYDRIPRKRICAAIFCDAIRAKRAGFSDRVAGFGHLVADGLHPSAPKRHFLCALFWRVGHGAPVIGEYEIWHKETSRFVCAPTWA